MTQESIDQLRRLYAELDRSKAAYKADQVLLRADIDAIIQHCDHKYPDGSSALKSGFTEDVCTICHGSVL